MNDLKAIQDKIRKLKALSASPNEAEAMAAAQKMSDLIEKYQIDNLDFLMNELKDDGIGVFRHDPVILRGSALWIGYAAKAAANIVGCKILMGFGKGLARVHWIGTKNDANLATEVFEGLSSIWMSIYQDDLKKVKARLVVSFQPKDTMRYKQGHGAGFFLRVCVRSEELKEARDARAKSSTGRDLVVTKDDMISAVYNRHASGKSGRATNTGSNLGFAMGYKAGMSVPLQSEVNKDGG